MNLNYLAPGFHRMAKSNNQVWNYPCQRPLFDNCWRFANSVVDSVVIFDIQNIVNSKLGNILNNIAVNHTDWKLYILRYSASFCLLTLQHLCSLCLDDAFHCVFWPLKK